jgi:hypothetical protein
VVEEVLAKYGWLSGDEVGENGNDALFLVIQHAYLKTQEKYLPMMREAVKKGNARPSTLAMLEDRILLRQGKKQIYGSQITSDKNGNQVVRPIENPDQVDQRRAAVGLEPLADYALRFGIVWELEQYKKELQALEENELRFIKK